MPRPDYIAALHEAKYELRFCEGVGKAEKLRRYKEALAEASRQSGIPGPLIEAAIRDDFRKWIKDEKLPKLPRSGRKQE